MSGNSPGKIGVFDSGYGGLTILKEMRRSLPEHDFLYLGDNARAPYGTRSFDVVYDFTRQAVEELFRRGCHLVVLACNTASAKALRSIQQGVLPGRWPGRRVLGVIRPTVERLGEVSRNGHVGILATQGTVRSHSYRMEIEKLHPGMRVTETACPMWVPIVENGEADGPGADWFVKKYIDAAMAADPQTDTLVLGCTHYPLLGGKIRQYAPEGVEIMSQGEIVGPSLADYLRRHPEIDALCTRGGSTEYLSTENPGIFSKMAAYFMEEPVEAAGIKL